MRSRSNAHLPPTVIWYEATYLEPEGFTPRNVAAEQYRGENASDHFLFVTGGLNNQDLFSMLSIVRLSNVDRLTASPHAACCRSPHPPTNSASAYADSIPRYLEISSTRAPRAWGLFRNFVRKVWK